LVDNKTVVNLGNLLQQVGDQAKALAGDITLPTGGDGGPPSGVQPPITISDYAQIALLCKDAGTRLAPSSLSASNSASDTFSIARFLYADGAINSAQDAIDHQIQPAKIFVAAGMKAIGDA